MKLVSQMSPRRGKKKEAPESGEDSDEYRKKRDRNNLVSQIQHISYFLLKVFVGCKTEPRQIKAENPRNTKPSQSAQEREFCVRRKSAHVNQRTWVFKRTVFGACIEQK